MRRKLRYLLALTLLLQAVAGISATEIPTAVRHISTEDGLPNATIVDMLQDRKGYLWFATKQGLVRFDGRRFISRHSGNSQLSGNELNTLLLDPQDPDLLWAGTEREGLNLYDIRHNTFRTFRHDPRDSTSLSSDEITQIAPALSGGIWIASYSGTIDYLPPEQSRFTHYHARNTRGMPQDPIWTLTQDKRGFLYVGHLHAGLTVISPDRRTAHNHRPRPGDASSLPDHEVLCLFIDPMENIWAGTRNGLALFNPLTGRFRTFRHTASDPHSLLSNQIYDIALKSDHELYIACRMGGVCTLDLRQELHNPATPVRFGRIPAGNKAHELPSIHVHSLLSDSYGNCWIGYESDGLSCIPHHSSPFRVWQYKESPTDDTRLHSRIPQSVGIEPGRGVWIGLDAAGVDFFAQGRSLPQRTEKINRILSQAIVQTIFRDSRGILYFGTFRHGILRYDPATEALHRLDPDPALPLHIRSMHEDRAGQIWIGTHHGIYLYRMADGSFHKPADINTAIRDNILCAIAGDRAGRIYVATYGRGITLFSPDGKVLQRQDKSTGFPSNAVHTLFCDIQGEVWAGTRKGLIQFHTRNGLPDLQNYTLYTEKDGLPEACIRAIQEDSQGNLWVATNNHLVRLHRKDHVFQSYARQDGLPGGEFQNNASARDENGRLYFVSRKGVVSFDPARFYQPLPLPRASITELIAYGHGDKPSEKSILLPEEAEEISFSSEENTLSIAFSIQDYALLSQAEYAYRLEGLEEEWYPTAERIVTFRSLPPGNYRFHLKYRLKGGEWHQLPQTVSFRILPPWWLAPWAKALYSLAILLLLADAFLRYHRRQKLETSLLIEQERHKRDEEIHNERLVFFTNITHELRTPLTLILDPLNTLLKKKEAYSREQQSLLELIQRNAARLRTLTDQILEFRKTETQNRRLCLCKADSSAVVKEIFWQFEESAKPRALRFRYLQNTPDTTLWFDREILAIILSNFLSNALKHTAQGEIRLRVEEKAWEGENYLVFTVEDTGQGIPPEELPHIFDRYYMGSDTQAGGTGIGLALVRNLADIHQARLTVESTPGCGSAFSLWLKKNGEYPGEIHLSPAPKAPDSPDPSSEPPHPETTDTKPILLLVEDHEEIRRYMAGILQADYRILTATQGEEGLQRAFETIPDLIVSDIMMPLMDGIELCRRIKSDLRTSHIPLILLTAKDTNEDRSEGYAMGADSYLTKPLDSELLRSRIANLLNSRRKLAETWAKTPAADRKEERKMSPIDRQFLQNLTATIETHIENGDLDIAFLAEKMHVSHSTLYRKVKALTEMNIQAFILHIRMQQAARLLSDEQLTVLEAMYRVGINTPAYFRKCFKEAFGCLPSEYRQGGKPYKHPAPETET